MGSQITRVLFGLQDLLGSKNFGDNPAEFGEIVIPTLEMFPFLSTERSVITSTDVVTLVDEGDIGSMVVPQGELWLLQQVGVYVNASTSAVLTLGASWHTFDNQSHADPSGDPVDRPAGLGSVFGAQSSMTNGSLSLTREYALYPLKSQEGIQFEMVRASGVGGAAPIDVNGFARYVRLTI